jgi:hypothetical protein
MMKGEAIRGAMFLILLTMLVLIATGIMLMIPVEGFKILGSALGK